MVSRATIETALAAADARLIALQPLMETYAAERLLDDQGRWSVRDCLCHVAQGSRVSWGARRALWRLDPTSAPAAASVPGPSIDERNQLEIEKRTGLSVAELVQEAVIGHRKALDDLRGWDDATLDLSVPDTQVTRPAQSVGGNFLRFLEYHEGGQVDRIEAAINVRTRWA